MGGGDISRAMVLFSEEKPLGPNGLDWLKIHLCNLFGINKISHEDRIKWVDERLDKIKDSAENPIDCKYKFWLEAEAPFQALTCMAEITKAFDSGNPQSYLSR